MTQTPLDKDSSRRPRRNVGLACRHLLKQISRTSTIINRSWTGGALTSASGREAGISFVGDYDAWEDAQRASTGFDASIILERTCASLLLVKQGDPRYERDSVLFDEPQYAWQMLSALLRIAVRNAGRLRVIDFGGSLGSSYFQCRRFLAGGTRLEWSVIEQPAYVHRGRERFLSEELRFYETAAEALNERPADVLLLSGVLQYLREPYQVLDSLLALGVPHLIVDRTAFVASGRERLTVQNVPEWIYRASYPAWFLNEARFVSAIRRRYDIVSDFEALDSAALAGECAYYKGFICDKQA